MLCLIFFIVLGIGVIAFRDDIKLYIKSLAYNVDEWKDNFQTFYDWAMSHGYSDELTIDRIDNNGNYEPSNCRWVDMKKQTRNNSRNHIVKLNGIERPLIEWTEIYKINYKTVRDRLKRG